MGKLYLLCWALILPTLSVAGYMAPTMQPSTSWGTDNMGWMGAGQQSYGGWQPFMGGGSASMSSPPSSMGVDGFGNPLSNQFDSSFGMMGGSPEQNSFSSVMGASNFGPIPAGQMREYFAAVELLEKKQPADVAIMSRQEQEFIFSKLNQAEITHSKLLSYLKEVYQKMDVLLDQLALSLGRNRVNLVRDTQDKLSLKDKLKVFLRISTTPNGVLAKLGQDHKKQLRSDLNALMEMEVMTTLPNDISREDVRMHRQRIQYALAEDPSLLAERGKTTLPSPASMGDEELEKIRQITKKWLGGAASPGRRRSRFSRSPTRNLNYEINILLMALNKPTTPEPIKGEIRQALAAMTISELSSLDKTMDGIDFARELRVFERKPAKKRSFFSSRSRSRRGTSTAAKFSKNWFVEMIGNFKEVLARIDKLPESLQTNLSSERTQAEAHLEELEEYKNKFAEASEEKSSEQDSDIRKGAVEAYEKLKTMSLGELMHSKGKVLSSLEAKVVLGLENPTELPRSITWNSLYAQKKRIDKAQANDEFLQLQKINPGRKPQEALKLIFSLAETLANNVFDGTDDEEPEESEIEELIQSVFSSLIDTRENKAIKAVTQMQSSIIEYSQIPERRRKTIDRNRLENYEVQLQRAIKLKISIKTESDDQSKELTTNTLEDWLDEIEELLLQSTLTDLEAIGESGLEGKDAKRLIVRYLEALKKALEVDDVQGPLRKKAVKYKAILYEKLSQN